MCVMCDKCGWKKISYSNRGITRQEIEVMKGTWETEKASCMLAQERLMTGFSDESVIKGCSKAVYNIQQGCGKISALHSTLAKSWSGACMVEHSLAESFSSQQNLIKIFEHFCQLTPVSFPASGICFWFTVQNHEASAVWILWKCFPYFSSRSAGANAPRLQSERVEQATDSEHALGFSVFRLGLEWQVRFSAPYAR